MAKPDIQDNFPAQENNALNLDAGLTTNKGLLELLSKNAEIKKIIREKLTAKQIDAAALNQIGADKMTALQVVETFNDENKGLLNSFSIDKADELYNADIAEGGERIY